MSNQTVLITGCSDGGIGAALAVLFQQRGWHVFATTRDPAKMGSLRDLPNVTLLALDVVKSKDIKAAVQAVSEKTGGTLDCLISNAGRNHFMPILDEDLDAVRNIFEINLMGPMALTHAFAPLLIKAKGIAVYVTSISGYLNIPYMGKSRHLLSAHTPRSLTRSSVGTYAASKRGLEIVAETLRLELAPFGVDVMEVVTGGVKSMGQTYFGDVKLPQGSLYKSIEDTFVSRARVMTACPGWRRWNMRPQLWMRSSSAPRVNSGVACTSSRSGWARRQPQCRSRPWMPEQSWEQGWMHCHQRNRR